MNRSKKKKTQQIVGKFSAAALNEPSSSYETCLRKACELTEINAHDVLTLQYLRISGSVSMYIYVRVRHDG